MSRKTNAELSKLDKNLLYWN